MEENSGIMNTILLLDNFNEISQLLYNSFKLAGYEGPIIVVNDNGFLPYDAITIYQYFCGITNDIASIPKYFNQIEIPDYWEIKANGHQGNIYDYSNNRGIIQYAEPKYKRLVNSVHWFDERGITRITDHYDRYGRLYAKTSYNKIGKAICKSYFNLNDEEVIVENFVTKDIILNRDGKVYIFNNKKELTLKVLEELNGFNCKVFYNSLSTPLFVSNDMPKDMRDDVLIWQEDNKNEIPYNMTCIFNDANRRTKNIYVTKKESYDELIELGAPKDLVHQLGYVYKFVKNNNYSNNALICTNSDNIESLEEIVKEFPNVVFHVAAITEMSSKLLYMSKYENVHLHPCANIKLAKELFNECDIYLDINHELEIFTAIKNAFLHNELIIGLKNTLHNKEYIAKEHVFEDSKSLIAFLSEVIDNKEVIDKHLDIQRHHANSIDVETYKKILK